MKTGALLPLLLASSLGPLTAATAQAARFPNIVVIFVDDQGYADIGPFGAKDYPTPHLDRMAREGCRFTNFHVAQPVCSASRAALLTGCYSNRIGIHSALFSRAKQGLAHGEITLAELVKQRGYATGMAGKWHLGDHPQFLPPRHGFDSSFGLPYSNDMWPFHPQPPVAFPPLPLIKDGEIIKPALDAKDQDQLTVQYTEHAVKFIEQNKDRPFFFYLAHSMVHVPLHVSERFRGKSKHGLYGDACMEVDWSVGEVLAALERSGINDDTWVIYTSDNGPWLSYGNHAGSAGPLREGKGTNWEGGTRVPTIMRWLGRIPANSTNDTMLMTIDLFPTIAKLIDVPLPDHKIDGLDVWPVIEGRKNATNPHEGYAFYYDQGALQAVSTGDGRWKLMFPHAYRTLAGRPGGRDGRPVPYQQRKLESAELYDLRNDIGETEDVAAKHPEIVERLQAFAAKTRNDLGDTLTKHKGTGLRQPGRVTMNRGNN